MLYRVLTRLFLFFLLMAEALQASNPVSIRLGQNKGGLRVVLDSKTPLKTGLYQGEEQKALLVNIMNGEITKNLPAPIMGIKTLSSQPIGQGKSQLILNATSPLKIEKHFSLPPCATYKTHRYVIDLQFLKKPPSSKPILQQLTEKSKMPTLGKNRKKVIIVDAGHGGRDPGTIGKNGTYEKHVTLRCAKLLAAALKKTNRYEVRMTRDTDVFIPLGQRVNFGRENHGDLFISLHADSSPNPDTRGLSVYTLSRIASDKEAARLAAKENKADLFMGINFDAEIPEVANILIDLTKRETMNLSIGFAQMVKNALTKNILLRDNTHRFANFAVLRTPDIPAVLVELGYLSNREDEKLLKTDPYLKKICDKLVLAIDLFYLEKRDV